MKQIFIFSDNRKDSIVYFEREPAILVSMNRNDLLYLKEQDFATYPAIYVLIGGNKRYVGQVAGQKIAQRLTQHFQNKANDWVESVLFFGRADGKMSKADTDYLERRLIKDFSEKSSYELTNSTKGNKSYIDKLQKAKSDQLYNIAFEILNDIANIDLFGTEKEESNTYNEDHPFKLTFENKVITAKSARKLYTKFAEAVIENPSYEAIIKKIVVEGCPTYSLIFGSEIGNYNGYSNAVRLSNGICLYNNLSRKGLREKINTIAQQVGVEYKILKWG